MARIVAAAIPLLVFTFHRIHHHYDDVAEALTTEDFSEDDSSRL